MKHIFVDTSAWDALADKKDKDHTNALRFRDMIIGKYKLLTSDYILDELYTLLLMNVGFLPTVNYKEKLDILIAEHVLDVIWIDHDLAKRGWNVFEQYNSDKLWSFTDCTSFVVMKEFGITEVFAFDHHFEQMGFTLLPSPDPSSPA
jgi:predicted nucleic acid-binding protein